MNETDEKIARAMSTAFLKNEPVIDKDSGNVLVENARAIKYKGETVCYCMDDASASMMVDALNALNAMMGMMLTKIVFGDKIKSDMEKLRRLEDEESSNG